MSFGPLPFLFVENSGVGRSDHPTLFLFSWKIDLCWQLSIHGFCIHPYVRNLAQLFNTVDDLLSIEQLDWFAEFKHTLAFPGRSFRVVRAIQVAESSATGTLGRRTD